jgi:mitochondrial import inner membrane translocase subunit TIM9
VCTILLLSMNMDQLSETERQDIIKTLEKKQTVQFVELFGIVLDTCFSNCVSNFTRKTLTDGELECSQRCTEKIMKITNRIGQKMNEKYSPPNDSRSDK